MSEWPDELEMGPLREWPGTLTPEGKRQSANFRSSYTAGSYQRNRTPLSTTLTDLKRELKAVNAKEVVMLIALESGQFRNDGRPRASALPDHPGIVLSFVTKIGQQSYPCDTFTRWQDNLRAIALSLESLRKVDRYGVTTNGQQYRGFLAIEGGIAMPSAITSEAQAFDVILKSAGDELLDPNWMQMPALVKAIRLAKRLNHPDLGGNASAMQRINEAEAFLRAAGKLVD